MSTGLAQSTVLAPTHYTLIIRSTFYGLVILGDLPDCWIGDNATASQALNVLRKVNPVYQAALDQLETAP